MSAKVFSLIADYYEPARFHAPIVLAYILGDEADDAGGGISESISELARKTRQEPRSVKRQMRALEQSGLLECEHRSAGGPENFSKYRFNLALLLTTPNGDPKPPLTVTLNHRSPPPNSDPKPPLEDTPYKGSTTKNVSDAPKVTVPDSEDARLAHWIFDKVRAINPKHREPRWDAWVKTIRLMRERDGRTRAEIARLFNWANSDSFWHRNILCPATLREQFDKLTIACRAAGGGGVHAPDPNDDGLCTRRFASGARCKNQWTWRESGKDPLCGHCAQELERERLGIGGSPREVQASA